jgi:hypothetical protein
MCEGMGVEATDGVMANVIRGMSPHLPILIALSEDGVELGEGSTCVGH